MPNPLNPLPLVLLHGFPFDHTLWHPVRLQLPADQVVLAPDLPGFGQEPPLPHLSMDAVADWLADWLSAQQVERAVVVGHSMGGYAALAFAARHPQRLAGLGLVHSSAAADTDEKKRSRDEQLAFVARHGADKLVPNLIRPLVADAHATRLRVALDAFVSKAAKLPASTVPATITALRDRPDRRELLPRLTAPFLLLSGRQDPMFNLDASREQASIAPTSTGVWLDQCGHLGPLEQPTAVAGALRALLRTASTT